MIQGNYEGYGFPFLVGKVLDEENSLFDCYLRFYGNSFEYVRDSFTGYSGGRFKLEPYLFSSGTFEKIPDILYIDTVSIFDLSKSRDGFLIHNDQIMDYIKDDQWFYDALDIAKSSESFYSKYDGEDKEHDVDEKALIILNKLNDIIKGKFSNQIILYYNPNDSVEPSSEYNISSGFKQLAVLYLLLENNNLKQGSYLIMDEPEVNLHPEWQFKFAEILVLLAKELDITLYINSHSPVFIESIDAFTEFYDMEEDINYYLTEESEDPGKYNFTKINSKELYKIYDNLGNVYDLIDQLRLRKRLGD